MIQSGVVVDDGPTLEEIQAQEKADAAAVAEESDVLAAAEASAEISEPSEDGADVEATEEGTDVPQEQENDDSKVDYSSLKVAELKELLKAAGKPVSGKKAELIARLEE